MMTWNVATLAALTLVIGLVVSLLKPTLERVLPTQHRAHDPVFRALPPGLGGLLSLAATLSQPLGPQTGPLYTPLAAGTALSTGPAPVSLLHALLGVGGGVLCGLLSLVVYWVHTRMRAPHTSAGGQHHG